MADVDTTNPHVGGQNGGVENKNEPLGNWVPRQAYDYERYVEKPKDPDAPRGQPSGEWLASGARYEWTEEYGEVGPAVLELEVELFGDPDEVSEKEKVGLDFER